LRLSSGNINGMKTEEYKMSKEHNTHGKADKSRKSSSESLKRRFYSAATDMEVNIKGNSVRICGLDLSGSVMEPVAEL